MYYRHLENTAIRSVSDYTIEFPKSSHHSIELVYQLGAPKAIQRSHSVNNDHSVSPCSQVAAVGGRMYSVNM